VDTNHFSLVREALFNTLRKYVHGAQKDTVIGTETTYVASKRKPRRPDLPNGEGRTVERINTPKKVHHLSPKKGEIRWLLLPETSDLIIKSSAYLSNLICFPIA
jgi:hypothetical protein